jgi:hypothetical protein
MGKMGKMGEMREMREMGEIGRFFSLVYFPSLSSLSCPHPKIKNLHL